ncbi:hypothetical protein DRH14_00170 [Candidatus Shapirobacteria bacterium]|nr:MAG: hypothetical protein DRH14_00170 [Candidatus Shapirobacteria bacterium]
MKKIIKHLATTAFLLLPIFLFLVNLKITAIGRNTTALKYNPKKDKLVTPIKKDISQQITLAGQIQAHQQTKLKFATSGKLVWVGVKLGDKVKKNQAIASLDKRELKKKLKKKLNDYLTNRWNFEDTQDEYQDERDKLIIDDEMQRILDRAQFSLNNAVIDVEISDLALKYATIYSPIDGIITNIEQDVTGVNITPTTAEFTITNPSSIYFQAEVDQEEVSLLTEKQSATVLLDAFDQQPLPATISYISFSPISGISSTSYQIDFQFQSPQLSQYRLGMTGDATIDLRQAKNSLCLPFEAINQDQEKSFVYLKKDNKDLEKRIVKTGIESDDYIQILDGLSMSDTIVIKQD